MEALSNFLRPSWTLGFKLGKEVFPVLKYKTVDLPSRDKIASAVQTMELLDHIRKNDAPLFLSLPYLDFMMAVDILKIPGEIIEEYFCSGMDKLHASLEKGDRRDFDGTTFQFKVSVIWIEKRHAMFRRIQIWQEVDNYRLVVVDKQNYYRPYFFVLSAEEMKRELKLLHAIPHNSTKVANKLNENTPESFSLNCSEDNPDFLRWNKQYRRNDLEIKYIALINSELSSSPVFLE